MSKPKKWKKPELENRSYTFEVRAESTDEGNIITGRPVVYASRTNLGWFDEIIERGALDKTDLNDVVFLANHNMEMIPMARSRRNNARSTMQLGVDSEGLIIERILLDTENNSTARALWSAVDRGDISGMSFRFSVDDEEWTELESDHPTRHIKSISSIVELSAVTWPAYSATSIDARSNAALESARLTLERARAEARASATPEGGDDLALEQAKTLTLILTGGTKNEKENSRKKTGEAAC